MELQLHLIAVQLEGKRGVHASVTPFTRDLSSEWSNVCLFIFVVAQTFLMRAIVAFLDTSKSCSLMLPDVSSKM